MKKFSFFSFVLFAAFQAESQTTVSPVLTGNGFNIIKNNEATVVKNQALTGTCWSFSTTSLVESQFLKNAGANSNIDLSEMYNVYNIYIEKAKNYVLRQGKAQFSEGGLGHDVIRSINLYGAVPESAFSGLKAGEKSFNHSKAIEQLKGYLDEVLKSQPLNADWLEGYKKMLNDLMGTPPSVFSYNGKEYTPKSFAAEVLKFNASDYVNLTSFLHHPFYQPFILEVPDNFSNGAYYNLPLSELKQAVDAALMKGYTIMWDADVSNNGFMARQGLALFAEPVKNESAAGDVNPDMPEQKYTAELRQQYYENLTTQDDHLMHITGIEKSKSGKTFYIVKNSWGNIGPYNGYMSVSEAYFDMNTISLVVPKAALSPELLARIGLK